MTTATTVAGRPLSGWSRDARHGTWHALLPAGSGEPALGALRVDRALLAPEGTRERLAAAVLAVARLRLPGVLGTVDLVAEAGDVWLITARPPAPTLADLLADGGPALDAGSAASVLNETAQTLLALHAAGLAHGALDTDTVVLAPDGVALLAGAALGTVLGDTLDGTRAREADIVAWAGLCRTLGEAWAPAGTPAEALFAHCSTTAAAEGLAAARAALVAGRAALPADFLRRTALRAAVAEAAPEITEVPSASPSPSPSAEGTGADSGGADSAPAAPTAAPDDQATVLGRRNRNRVPAESPAAAPPPTSEDDDEILLRFGPGIPVEAQDTLRAQWRTAHLPPDRRQRRRRRGWIATTAVLTIAAVLLWLLLRPSPAPTVTAVEVQAPTGRLHCGQTADLVGVVTTDGRGGPVTYHWLRSDGHDSGELVHMAHRGDRRVTVHLRWTVRGPGSFRGTARLRIAHQRKPVEARATFRYACS
ncbi:hypothetical protein [Streptomyces sp. HUAS TT20]|uniref:hypothetical protein n=1 Tax=Streptomyces sp. HUAS TT20 TaxID=3447509 RepID=UPI0021D8B214|nr:hypothetical protein [Streptomyces sp. HUAS 15-9]UXY30934.1 hypothetical protein N8I87_33195 [Streptomyces sp. HUAS 15-9]